VLSLALAGEPPKTATLDRARGVSIGDIEVFQSIPTGLAVVIETRGEKHALHLTHTGPRTASADFSGGRLVVTSERDLTDPLGTGALSTVLLGPTGTETPLALGQPFALGPEPGRLVAWTRWARFSYTRSPGVLLVFGGFFLLLLGATLLAIPCGVARLGAGGENACRVWVPRGGEALLSEWERGEP